MKKTLALIAALLMALSLFAGCQKAEAPAPAAEPAAEAPAAAEPVAEAPAPEEPGKVYYLNFKPEQDEQWQGLAKLYTETTGVQVDVITAASGTYEATLKSEIAKSEAPTLFQVNGPVGLNTWQDYCDDMSKSDVYAELSSDDFALKGDAGAVYGIAYVIETYGIIYNKALLDQYMATKDAKIADVSEINSFMKLKEVADDIQAKKKELKIDGAFTSAGMDGSSDWRFKTHLANLPLYYEYKGEGNFGLHPTVTGSTLDLYKQIWDLYITDATCKPGVLSAKTGSDAVAEFATGKAVFYQNGTWAYNDIKDLGDENLGMLPIFVGGEGEENQGLCTGSENYWCVNAKASDADKKATYDFINWVVTSDEGRKCLSQDMGFVCPFKGFTGEYLPSNPLVLAADEYISSGKSSVAWCFSTMPSEDWKNGVGSALTAYASGKGDWEAVKTAFVDGWASEYTKAFGA